MSFCLSKSESDDDDESVSIAMKSLLDCWDDWIGPSQLDTVLNVQPSSRDPDPEVIDLDDYGQT